MKVWSIIFSMVAALLLALALRLFALGLVTINGPGDEPILEQGDRTLVGLWAYGLRCPISKVFGQHRWHERTPMRGDMVVYNYPGNSPEALPDTSCLQVSACRALPGDTVWLGTRGHVSMYRNSRHSQMWPMVVPAQGMYIRITPWNASLYARIINQHEESDVATVKGDSLYIKGRAVRYYRFRHDYYWLQNINHQDMNDSRTMGFIPHRYLYGRILWKTNFRNIFSRHGNDK